jgi:serine/threonine protein kinase/Tol biopolymer transport system component
VTTRWAKIERVYHEALACGAHEREAFLAEVCAGDDGLRREVESLLAHDGGAAFLSTPAVAPDLGEGIRIGQALGPYLISAQIGEGGMGEVYRARDTKLGRDVAIKIVSGALASDPERLARFEREARLLASLNHPHIGAIYGVEESNDVRALVLELVEGRTLAENLTGEVAGLPVPEAVAIARQIAEALDAAHERGIVHRDLKPANIAITPAGTVKVLDFGLAKVVTSDASSADLSKSPTVTADATRAGTILGTAAYMSPEQARGQVIDKRTDIWSFGCVFYELLTGRPAFARPTVSDTIAAILTQEPDWSRLPPGTPPHLGNLLSRCLAKDSTRRLRDIGDARLELAPVDHPEAVDQKRQGLPRRLNWRAASVVGIGALAVAAMGFAFGVFVRPRAEPSTHVSAVRFSMLPPQGSRFRHTVASNFLALSPDGSQLAFLATAPPNRSVIWLRPISALEARIIPGTEDAVSVFWSPDGRSLAFFAGAKLKRIDLPSGAAVTLCDVPAVVASGTWGREGTILFAPFLGAAIFSVSSNGGKPEVVVTPDSSLGEQVVWPSFLPDGKRFLYLSQRPNSTGQLMLGEQGQAPRPIVSALSNVQWVDPDFLVFAQEGVLVAQRFDLVSARTLGAPIAIADSVDHFLSSGRAMFSASPNGTIAYHSFANVARLVWIDRTGKEVETVGDPGDYLTVRVSTDGGTALFPRTRPGIGTWDIYTADLIHGIERRLTSDQGSEAYPVWMPDGRAIFFADGRNGGFLNLARKRLDTGVEDHLLPIESLQRRPMDVSPDGRTLLFTERKGTGALDILMLPLSGQGKPTGLFASPASEADPRFSPDGKAIAFTSNESGRLEVYVAPFPTTGAKIPVSAGIYAGVDQQGGARWSHDGRELFYVSADRRLMTVPVRTTPTLELGSASALFALPERAWEDFATSPDGKRFLAVVPQAFAGEQPLTVVLNWITEARR